MVEVVRISREERSMPFTNHVVVEITHAGPVRASGASNLGEDVVYYAPPLFHSVRAALVAASAWAAEHGIHAIHLYADNSQLLDDCASLEVLSEEAQAKVVDQAQVAKKLPKGSDKLEAERVLSQMRQNEASIELNRSLNDCE